jgi:hypothetical protein
LPQCAQRLAQRRVRQPGERWLRPDFRPELLQAPVDVADSRQQCALASSAVTAQPVKETVGQHVAEASGGPTR